MDKEYIDQDLVDEIVNYKITLLWRWKLLGIYTPNSLLIEMDHISVYHLTQWFYLDHLGKYQFAKKHNLLPELP